MRSLQVILSVSALALAGAVVFDAWAASSVVPVKRGQAGSVSVAVVDTSKAITFATPMEGTNYAILLSPSAGTTLSWSAKATTGFTITISVGLNGRIDWLAEPIQ